MRYAIGAGKPETVARYLPGNYEVIGEVEDPDTGVTVTIIAGEDSHGWTLDDYVIPRLQSGLYFAKEIGLDHPVVKEITNA